ncbi:MAG: hypothetical protein M3389_12280 [Actinomycetota bacterium]|nr:hypothetical protein [Actinomycetota bacterium]
MRTPLTAAAAILILSVTAGVAQAQDVAPKLLRFDATDRIATGKVARYDLREESTSFGYRVRAQRIQVAVFKRRAGEWVRIGSVKATPPRPLNFWPVFRRMSTGRYKLVARAVNGRGDDVQRSRAKTIRFRVVEHIPHDD